MSSGRRSSTSPSGLTALEQSFELAGLHEHALRARLLGAGVGGIGELVPGQDYAGPGVTEVERDLALLEQRVHRHDGGADTQRAVVADREVRDVGQHDAHAVSRLHALCAQQSGNAGRRLVKLGVAQFASSTLMATWSGRRSALWLSRSAMLAMSSPVRAGGGWERRAR